MNRRNLDDLQKDVERAKNDSERALAFYNLGQFHDKNNREPLAIPNYKKALDLGLDDKIKAQCLAWLASSFYKTGEPKKAYDMAQASGAITTDEKLRKFLLRLLNTIRKKPFYYSSNDDYTPEALHNEFAGYYDLRAEDSERLFFLALAKLPHNAADFAKKIFFISGHPDSSGAQGLMVGDKGFVGIIHFYPKFWEMHPKDVEDGVAHEIAHLYLGHKFDADGVTSEKMEDDANNLASKWLHRKVVIGQQKFRRV